MPTPTPVFDDVLAAAARIAPHAVRTPVLHSAELDRWAGATLLFKAEHLQHVGAFKFRGACNAVMALDPDTAARGVLTHSSGNHGAALAMAARVRGIPAHVVVPEGAVASKLAAIEAHGAVIHRCAPTIAAREATAARVQADTGASLVHPYTDPRVIAGQGTAALELLAETGPLDALVTPLGGGEPITWAQSLALNYTDGIVVLHRGRIVYERYFGALTEEGQHGLMSVTKSFTGLLGAVLVLPQGRGVLAVDAMNKALDSGFMAGALSLEAFRANPHHAEAVRLRRYDEEAKDPRARTPDFDHYLRHVAACQRT